jgi:hypothetical protein
VGLPDFGLESTGGAARRWRVVGEELRRNFSTTRFLEI